MPCFSDWDQNLAPGTSEYLQVEAQIRAKLKSVLHIIDYYYSVAGYPKPNLPDGTRIDPQRQPKSPTEIKIRNAICHHFVCDGVTPQTLHDVRSLLHDERPDERQYLAIILPCFTLLRLQPLRPLIT